ncbi:MAG: hypothetical protein E4H13_06915 [Calditrichales bacterium]|nr:MAG: hypothetical protein E4H13_06915 [Calditrichales bacterium]
MKKFWQIIYNYFTAPLIFILAHLVSVFSRKVRNGVYPRYRSINQVEAWIQKQPDTQKRVIFHAASLGEFEHIRPLLEEFKSQYQTTNIVFFFSPSGYEHVGTPRGLDAYFYMPFDRPKNWNRLFNIIKPTMLIVAKHDVWPAQIWTARHYAIPTFLINASLREKSSRSKHLVKRFLKHVYRDFDYIYAISEDDTRRFATHYPRCRVETMGDTKYDQVVVRKKQAKSVELLPESWIKEDWIFVGGSVWPEDTAHLFPALVRLLEKKPQLKVILVPHQPVEKAVKNIEEKFFQWGTKRFSQRETLQTERVLIVDAIGYLAGIYHYAKAAYVGGSFHQGVHNVMEPAIFGIPVLYGPVHTNSYEAIQFSENNGGQVVTNADEIYRAIGTLYENEAQRQAVGLQAKQFATRNTGATERLIVKWKHLLA